MMSTRIKFVLTLCFIFQIHINDVETGLLQNYQHIERHYLLTTDDPPKETEFYEPTMTTGSILTWRKFLEQNITPRSISKQRIIQESNTTPESILILRPFLKQNTSPESIPKLRLFLEPNTSPESIPTLRPFLEPNTSPESIPKLRPFLEPNTSPESIPKLRPFLEPNTSPESIPKLRPFRKPNISPESIPKWIRDIYIQDTTVTPIMNHIPTTTFTPIIEQNKISGSASKITSNMNPFRTSKPIKNPVLNTTLTNSTIKANECVGGYQPGIRYKNGICSTLKHIIGRTILENARNCQELCEKTSWCLYWSFGESGMCCKNKENIKFIKKDFRYISGSQNACPQIYTANECVGRYQPGIRYKKGMCSMLKNIAGRTLLINAIKCQKFCKKTSWCLYWSFGAGGMCCRHKKNIKYIKQDFRFVSGSENACREVKGREIVNSTLHPKPIVKAIPRQHAQTVKSTRKPASSYHDYQLPIHGEEFLRKGIGDRVEVNQANIPNFEQLSTGNRKGPKKRKFYSHIYMPDVHTKDTDVRTLKIYKNNKHKAIAGDCQRKKGNGKYYIGIVSKTKSGLTCQKWTSQSPHKHVFGYLGNHNFCRNPNGGPSVWCYTTHAKTWEICDVPFCNNMTRALGKGRVFFYHNVAPTYIVSSVMDSRKCCKECQNKNPDTQMFNFDNRHKVCICSKTIPGKQPITFQNSNFFADLCE